MAIYRISAIAETENCMNGKRIFVQVENIISGQEASFQINERFNVKEFTNKQFELEDFLTELQKANAESNIKQ